MWLRQKKNPGLLSPLNPHPHWGITGNLDNKLAQENSLVGKAEHILSHHPCSNKYSLCLFLL